MANTYDLLGSVTVGAGGAGAITFSSIPQDYTDLQVLLSVRSGASFTRRVLALTVNNIANQYRDAYMVGNAGGDAATSAQDTPTQSNILIWDAPAATAYAGAFSNISVYFTNYKSSANKSISNDGTSEDNNATAYLAILGGMYLQTSAINQINFEVSGNFTQHSTAYLYGIKNT